MTKYIFILTILAVISFQRVISQIDALSSDSLFSISDTIKQDFGLFDSDEILNISLRFDISYYKKKKPKDEYMNAVLTYYISSTDSISKEVRLRSRGNLRYGYCNFPPIRLNFETAEFKDTEFRNINKLKMVTHCETGNEIYLFKEYLAYKLFNLLTNYSFRVRLARVNYINTAKECKPIETYAFFIEPLEMLAKRNNSVPVNTSNLTQKNIYPEMMDRMAIFNYMIGNTDWSVPIKHNCEFLAGLNPDNSGYAIIVPYDFDYSGFVDADYSVPYKGLNLTSVRERRYLGICRSRDVYLNALKEFVDKKEEFYSLINEFPLLDKKTKKVMIRYIGDFYDQIDRNNTIIYEMMNGCISF